MMPKGSQERRWTDRKMSDSDLIVLKQTHLGKISHRNFADYGVNPFIHG